MTAICLGRNHQLTIGPVGQTFPTRGGVGFTPDALRKTIGMLKKVGGLGFQFFCPPFCPHFFLGMYCKICSRVIRDSSLKKMGTISDNSFADVRRCCPFQTCQFEENKRRKWRGIPAMAV